MPRIILAAAALIVALSGPAMAGSDAAPGAGHAQAGQKKVELYVTDWCGYCKKALKYLDARGIAYAAYDIEKDAAAKQRYQAMGGQGVPFIVIGHNRFSGFSPQALERYLR